MWSPTNMLPPTAFAAGGGKYTYNEAKKECREEPRNRERTYIFGHILYIQKTRLIILGPKDDNDCAPCPRSSCWVGTSAMGR